jgi:hypothetical protein
METINDLVKLDTRIYIFNRYKSAFNGGASFSYYVIIKDSLRCIDSHLSFSAGAKFSSHGGLRIEKNVFMTGGISINEGRRFLEKMLSVTHGYNDALYISQNALDMFAGSY